MPLKVTEARTLEEKQIAFNLRYHVFIDEHKFDPELEVDEHDHKTTTLHFIGRDEEQDKFVAVARVLLDVQNRRAKVSRVAVLEECRGKKFGVALMGAIEDAVRDRVNLLALAALLYKCGFYEKCGYKRLNNETHFEEGAELCWMVKSIAT